MSEYSKNIIASETPDGMIYIDDRTDNYVELHVNHPSLRQELFCLRILEEAFWVMYGSNDKVAVRVEPQ